MTSPRPSPDSWNNWAGNVTAHPREVRHPRSIEDVVVAVSEAGRRGLSIKALGAGHSFTDVAATAGMHLRLSGLSGIIRADSETGRVRVRAGTTLHELNRVLWSLGLAMPNLGDIDRQSLAGAISTGTHGTGADLVSLAGAVTGARMVLADGSVLTVDAEQNADLLPAVTVNLGALGVVIDYDLQTIPAYRLRAVEEPDTLDAVLESLDHRVNSSRHFEFYWMPYADRVLTKSNDLAHPEDGGRPLPAWRERLDDGLVSNDLFGLVCEAAARQPRRVPRINRVAASFLRPRRYTDRSYRVFCSRRDVRFVESEYAVPRESTEAVIRELRAWIAGSGEPLPFPLEVRFSAAEESWLASAQGRPTAYIAVHQFHRLDHHRYFAAFESIVAEHGGRPHWGKLHSLGVADTRTRWPRLDDFLAVRDRLDPERRFANDYLDRVLGR